MTGYHPMTLAELGGRLARTADAKMRWKLVWEFLEEYRCEQAEAQPLLLQKEPAPVADERSSRTDQRVPTGSITTVDQLRSSSSKTMTELGTLQALAYGMGLRAAAAWASQVRSLQRSASVRADIMRSSIAIAWR